VFRAALTPTWTLPRSHHGRTVPKRAPAPTSSRGRLLHENWGVNASRANEKSLPVISKRPANSTTSRFAHRWESNTRKEQALVRQRPIQANTPGFFLQLEMVQDFHGNT